jgi:hypothetical protein
MEDETGFIWTKIMFQAMTFDMKLMYWSLKVKAEKLRNALGALCCFHFSPDESTRRVSIVSPGKEFEKRCKEMTTEKKKQENTRRN